MNRWVVSLVVVALLAFGTVIGFNLFVNDKIKKALANMPQPVYPVSVETLKPTVWPQKIEAIGFIEPNQGVEVSNEVAGIITKIGFANGDNVKTGDLLLQIDSTVQKAQLKTLQVQLPAIKDDYLRLKKLYAENSVSQQSFQASQSKYEELQANIESVKATIALREIKAPFDGVLGIRNINLGQYASAGTNMVRLEDLSKMRVRFSVPQAQIGKLSVNQAINLTVEAYPQRVYRGTINAIEPVVNYKTGMVEVQAELPNKDGTLRGGMFASVNIALPNLTKQFVVPKTAIVYALYGNSIFVVEGAKDDLQVKQITIDVLQRNGPNALVKGALTFNQQVVTTGILNLSNNSKVKVVPNPISLPKKLPQL